MPLFVSTVTSQSWTQRTSSLWPSTCLPASEPASSLRYMLIAQVSVAQWLWPSTCLPASEPASSLRYMLIAQVSVAQWLCSALGGNSNLIPSLHSAAWGGGYSRYFTKELCSHAVYVSLQPAAFSAHIFLCRRYTL